MGEARNYIPIRTTARFREAQRDEAFLGWLKMQEAASYLTFIVDDIDLSADATFLEVSLPVVERAIVETFEGKGNFWMDEEFGPKAMRYVYYIGETFRKAFEGEWVSVPIERDGRFGADPAIDVPFAEDFLRPTRLFGFALDRKTGNELKKQYVIWNRDYTEWLDRGRPERVFDGTLRE